MDEERDCENRILLNHPSVTRVAGYFSRGKIIFMYPLLEDLYKGEVVYTGDQKSEGSFI